MTMSAGHRFLLHIGTEKTGSSFLQTQCARHRTALEKQGIWFPKGTRYDERCMLRGEISAGNGRILAENISTSDWVRVKKGLGDSASQASRRHCESVLVSSEWLLPAFARYGVVERLTEILSGLGFKSIEMLLVLRDPADQFLSLYKHRAKYGTAGNIEEWAREGYALPSQLKALRQQLAGSRIGLCASRYTPAPGALEQLFFEKWIGVACPKDEVRRIVNPSLSLSDLVLIRELATYQADLVHDLYERLLRIPQGEKVQGVELEKFSRAVAAQAVAAYADEWGQWNAILPEEEKLEWPSSTAKLPKRPRELEFSEAQLQVVMQLLAATMKLRFRAALLWRNKLRPFLGRVKRLLATPLVRISGGP